MGIDYFIRPGSKAAVVYFHGLGTAKEWFSEALKHPDFKDYTLVAIDFPGFGKSPYPKDKTLDLNGLVQITHDFLKKQGIEKYFIVGHSMGGLLGILYAEKYPQEVLGFVNVDGSLKPGYGLVARKAAAMSFDSFKNDFFEKFRKECAASPKKGLQAYAQSLLQSDLVAFYHYACSMTKEVNQGDLMERFQKLKCSKIFVYGSESLDLPYLPEVKEKICPIFEIPSSTHFMMYDNPDAYYRVISDFLKQH